MSVYRTTQISRRIHATLRANARRSVSQLACMLLVGTLPTISACADPGPARVADEAPVAVGGAEPQDSPIPTGDASAPDLPQILSVGAPVTVLPGQVVSVRLGTNFDEAASIVGVAIVIDGVPGWFKATTEAQPAALSDGVDWVLVVPVVVADTAPAGEEVRLEFALLLEGDVAGGFEQWQPMIHADEVASCPEQSDCSAVACGPDPICGFHCGGCDPGDTCNGEGQCEVIGSACPDLAACGDRVCGADPVCGTSCGTCGMGELCTLAGECVPGEMSCGDGQISGTEVCDGDALNDQTCESRGFDAGTLACNDTCTGFDNTACSYTCGDGELDPGELCDGEELGTETCQSRGFDAGGLGCNSSCDGFDNSGCAYTCGDGDLDPGEPCDDGNTDASDGCDANCNLESGWQCVGDPSICAESCGNGTIDLGEDCDDSNTDVADGCDANCSQEPGWLCTGEPSVCDETCGDGSIDLGEQCDDTNIDLDDGCDANCAVEFGWQCTGAPSTCVEICGNGVLDPTEECDTTEFGSATCVSEGFESGSLACSAGCTIDTGACLGCGDGILNGTELCDGAELGTGSCLDGGFDLGTVTCASTCDAFDFTACTYMCGDNGIDPGEVCDGSDIDLQDCSSQGFDAGTLDCATNCLSFDTTACTDICGNDAVAPTETCDGTDLQGQDCASQGFVTGTLRCDVGCDTYDTSACVAAGAVAPLYPANGAGWNQWVTATPGTSPLDATDTPCDRESASQCSGVIDGTVGPGEFACKAAGQLRQLVLPYASCAGVSASDTLNAFDWICDDSSGTAVAISTGLKPGVHLSDLLDWGQTPVVWRENAVAYTDGATPGNSPSSQWWPDLVTTHNTGGVLPSNPGVFVVTNNVALSYAFSGSEQALVSGPGVVISGLGLGTTVIDSKGTSVDPHDFLWLEVNLDAQNDEDAILFEQSNYVVVDNTTIQNVNEAGSSAIDIFNTCDGYWVLDTTLTNVNEGLIFRGGECFVVEDLLVDGGVNSSHSGLTFNNSSHIAVSRVDSHNNSIYGISTQNGDFGEFTDIRTTGNGTAGINHTTSSTQIRGRNLTVANNAGNGLAGGGGTNHFTNVFSSNNQTDGISCAGCRVQGFISTNNGSDGVFGVDVLSHGIAASNQSAGLTGVGTTVAVTSALNDQDGYTGTRAPNLNLAAVNNKGYGFRPGADSYVSDLLSVFNNRDAPTQPWDIYELNTGVTYHGLIEVTQPVNTSVTNSSNSSCESNDNAPPNGGHGIDDDCGPQNGSTFVTPTSTTGLPAFVGYPSPDATNASDGGVGFAVFESITDWTDFDNPYRAWGENGPVLPDDESAGACRTTAEVCAIHDWRVASGDVLLQDALGASYSVDATTDAVDYTFGTHIDTQAECDDLGGAFNVPIADFCSVSFLRRAMEIQDDGIGNDNALCESGEDCIRLRHIGGYQGTGTLMQVQTIGTGGTIENVRLFEYDGW